MASVFILLYLYDCLSRILSMVNISMLLSNLSSRISTMFYYSSGSLDSIWFIISSSSIRTPNFLTSPLNNSSSVIESSGSLVTSSNLLLRVYLIFFSCMLLSLAANFFVISPMHVKRIHWVTI